MKKYFIILSVMLSFLIIVSCASIFSGNKDVVNIKSEPIGADIYIDGNKIDSKTPAAVKLKRGKSYIIEIKMAGYETYRINTGKSITGWFWGNLICGGLIGMVIDLATGNAYDVDPDNISITLSKGTGMIERMYQGDFGNLKIFDENGHSLGSLQITWE